MLGLVRWWRSRALVGSSREQSKICCRQSVAWWDFFSPSPFGMGNVLLAADGSRGSFGPMIGSRRDRRTVPGQADGKLFTKIRWATQNAQKNWCLHTQRVGHISNLLWVGYMLHFYVLIFVFGLWGYYWVRMGWKIQHTIRSDVAIMRFWSIDSYYSELVFWDRNY